MVTKQRNQNGFFQRWYRQVSYAWLNVYNNLCRHRWVAILTILVIAISITLPTVCYLLWKNANNATKQWSPTPNLTVYLKKEVDKAQIALLKTEILHLSGVKNVEYRSRKKNMEEFRDWSGFSEALDLLDENPLPPLFIVIVNDSSKETTLLHQLQKNIAVLDGVDEVRLDDSWFTQLTALTGLVASVAWALSLLMLIAVFLVIGNSVRLMIFVRRQTIAIMQLIGATEGFILRPFLYSGMFHGFISAVLALILAEIFIFRVDSIIVDVVSVFGTTFMLCGLSWEESVSIIFLATFIGWLSAWLSTKKYLQIAESQL